MFKPDLIENLLVSSFGNGDKIVVSLWGIEADMEDNWHEQRVFISPDMLTFSSLRLAIHDADGLEKVLIGSCCDADDQRHASRYFRADAFFGKERSAVWDAIEDHINEIGNEELSDRDWDADAAEIEADMRYHLQKENP